MSMITPAGAGRWRKLAGGIFILTVVMLLGCRQQPTSVKPIVQLGHAHPLIGLAFSPDDSRLFTADGKCVMVWDAKTGKKLNERPWTCKPPQHHSKSRASIFHFVDGGRQVIVGGELWDVPSGQFVRLLLDKDDAPLATSISPDGNHVYYALTNNDICVVEIATGQCIAELTLPEPADPNRRHHPEAVSVGRKGPQALVRESFHAMILWDVTSGETLLRRDARLEGGSLSPDGRYFVTRNWEDTGSSVEEATIVDTSNGREIASLWEPFDRPDSIKFLPDGEHIIAGIGRKEAQLRHLGTGKQVRSFPGHARGIYAIDTDEDGRTMETRSCDATIRWDIFSGKKLAEYRHPQSEKLAEKRMVGDADFERRGGYRVVPSRDGNSFLASSGNSVWRIDSRTKETILKFDIGLVPRLRSGGYITDIEVSPTGRTALCKHSLAALLRDFKSGKVLAQVYQKPIPDDHVQLSPDGRFALTSVSGEPVRLWDTSNGRLLQMIGYAGDNRTRVGPKVAFSYNGDYVFTRGRYNNGGTFFWQSDSGAPLHQSPRDNQPANRQGLVVSSDERHVYYGNSSAHPNGRLRACTYTDVKIDDAMRPARDCVAVWDTETAKRVHEFKREDSIPAWLLFDPEGEFLAIRWYIQSTTRLVFEFRNVESGAVVHTVQCPVVQPARVPNVHFVPASNKVLLSDGARTLYLWDLDSREQIAKLTDTRPIQFRNNPPLLLPEVLFSSDGRYVLADYASRHAVLWDLVTGKDLHTFVGDRGNCDLSTNFAFSPDGRRFISRMRDDDSEYPVYLWDLENGCHQVAGTDFDSRTSPVLRPNSAGWISESWGGCTLFDHDSGKQKIKFSGAPTVAGPVQYSISMDGQRAIGRTEPEKTLSLWDLKSLTPIVSFEPAIADEDLRSGTVSTYMRPAAIDWGQHRAVFVNRAYDPKTKLDQKNSISIWNLDDATPIATNLVHEDPTARIVATLIDPNSGDAITASADGTAIRWDGSNGKKVMTFPDVPWDAKYAALTTAGNRLVVRCDNGSFKLWNLKTGTPLQHCYLFHNTSRWLTIDPSGKAHGNIEYAQ